MITDLTYLKSLASNDESFIRDMINIFIEQIEEYRIGMQELFDKAEYDKLSKLAHKAKSSVAVMGMSAEAEMLQKLEVLAIKSEAIDSYQVMIDQFIDKTALAIKELEEAYP